MENLLVPYQCVAQLQATRPLVFAPHPDDEIFGCGGAIRAFVSAGVPVRVIVLTDGAQAGDAATRAMESRRAATVIGYGEPIFWELQDRSLQFGEKLVQMLAQAIEDWDADLVLAPSLLEIHPDHHACAMAALEAVRRKGCRAACYECGHPLHPNLLLDITPLMDIKREAMACFESQLARQDYAGQIEALNRYRTYTLSKDVQAAEAFAMVDTTAEIPPAVYGGEFAWQHSAGIDSSEASAPRVSIIVRSVDRPTLVTALDSIAWQTYPNIEVILVHASGPTHRSYGDWCGRFPLLDLHSSAPLDRSAAANAGLSAASGDYALFLDDDDWCKSDHIERLAQALNSHPRIPAAYAGICVADSDGRPLGTTYDRSFDPDRLLIENYLPIHAVLFRRELAESADCSFDETLGVYEDWDFWLQLSQLGPFLHVPGFSAYYRQGTGNSGVHDAARYNDLPLQLIYGKWLNKWDSNALARAMNSLLFEWREQAGDLHRRIGLLETKLNETENASRTALENKSASDKRIEEMQNSLSWRITAPLRWGSRHMRGSMLFARFVRHLLKHPLHLPEYSRQMRNTWRHEGLKGIKHTIRHLAFEVSPNVAWREYKRRRGSAIRKYVSAAILRMEQRPLVSILMPTFNSDPTLLETAIQSVKDQFYPEWELCIADDGSSNPATRQTIERLARNDARIRPVFLTDNRGVSAATNAALASALGKYAVLMDHDDLLEPQALFRVAEAFGEEEDVDMIYSDEALVAADGQTVIDFTLRPAFSPELLRAHPYIVHLVGFRTSFLKELGGLDETLTISQDYDLVLRATEKARSISHIPEIIYLWRQHSASTGQSRKNEVMATSRRVLTNHLARCGENGRIENQATFNFFDVRYPLETGLKVAILIPTKNHGALVKQCVKSIEQTVTKTNYEIVIIDHASDDAISLDCFAELGQHHQVLRYEGPFNFSAINNWAVGQLTKDGFSHYLFCNNDIEAIEAGWLERMLELAQKPDIGIVGAKLFYPDGHTYQHAGVCVGLYGAAEHYAKFMDQRLPDGREHPGRLGSLIANHEVSAVTAACLLMRHEAFAAIKGFDESLAVGFGDVDLCLRTREAGFRVLFCPHAVLLHHESLTRGKSTTDPHPEDSSLFQTRYARLIEEGDPYFNPGYSRDDPRWAIRVPIDFSPQLHRRTIHCRLEENQESGTTP